MNFVISIILFLNFIVISPPAYAQQPSDTPHITLILNQVRGNECCSAGSVEVFKQQLQSLQQNDLVGSFAVRFDALQSEEYLDIIKKDARNEYGALLEITPNLTEQAGVAYKSPPEKWYEAQNVFLIGYTQAERKKIIDTYMKMYQSKLRMLPKFSSAWMIDAWSLSYLKQQYGVLTHQLTREQFGTDSYTLSGGPAHYPYYPSNNWALIPQEKNETMPLIIRQTISDPVYNYGDRSNSYTSQPNDYFLREDTIEYFKHLFYQAHAQQNSYTFALIGLENSMPAATETEFEKQLLEVGNWKKKNQNNLVETVTAFEDWIKNRNTDSVISYAGSASTNPREKAWWISTLRYRARVRLSNNQLSITDLRVYDPEFRDPYVTQTAKSLGWWIVPFTLDASRYYEGNTDGSFPSNDSLLQRSKAFGNPIQIVVRTGIENVTFESGVDTKTFKDSSGKVLLTFTPTQIIATQNMSTQPQLKKLPSPLLGVNWSRPGQENCFGFTVDKFTFTAYARCKNLDELRKEYITFLFPEKKFEAIDINKSYVLVSNEYASAGRNPVRLAFFPKNSSGDPVLLPKLPVIESDKKLDGITIHEQQQSTGIVFVDVSNSAPIKTDIQFTYDGFEKKFTAYFAPNCKQQVLYCITHPLEIPWYIKNAQDDKKRIQEEKDQRKADINE